MKKYIQYLQYLFRHKFWVAIYSWQLGNIFLGLLHDNSKFLPSELIPYTNYFYGGKHDIKRGRDKTGYYKPTDTGDAAFDYAWFLHQKRNKHHWQYWVFPQDDGGFKTVDIPLRYRKEMLADWKGAGKALGTPDTKAWYLAHKEIIIFHPNTRKWIEQELEISEEKQDKLL